MAIQTFFSHPNDKKKLKIISAGSSVLSGFFGAAGALSFNWAVQSWLRRDMKDVNGLALFTISLSLITSIVIRTLWPIQIIHINWHILFISLTCGMIGVVFGKRYESRLKEMHLRRLFMLILFFVGLKLLGVIPEPLFFSSYLPVGTWGITAFWSFIAGISSPLLGMGAGVFLIPTFLGIGFPRDEAILTSLIISALLMLLGAWLFHKAKRLEIKDLRHVWFPAIAGAPAGIWLSYQISPEYFRNLFGILLIVGASKTFYDINPRFRQLIRVIFPFYSTRIKRNFMK